MSDYLAAADAVWHTLPALVQASVNRDDFIMGFKLGRASMKAQFDSAEMLKASDPVPDKPFTPEPTTTNQQTR